jgi:hypothetical protein
MEEVTTEDKKINKSDLLEMKYILKIYIRLIFYIDRLLTNKNRTLTVSENENIRDALMQHGMFRRSYDQINSYSFSQFMLQTMFSKICGQSHTGKCDEYDEISKLFGSIGLNTIDIKIIKIRLFEVIDLINSKITQTEKVIQMRTAIKKLIMDLSSKKDLETILAELRELMQQKGLDGKSLIEDQNLQGLINDILTNIESNGQQQGVVPNRVAGNIRPKKPGANTDPNPLAIIGTQRPEVVPEVVPKVVPKVVPQPQPEVVQPVPGQGTPDADIIAAALIANLDNVPLPEPAPEVIQPPPPPPPPPLPQPQPEVVPGTPDANLIAAALIANLDNVPLPEPAPEVIQPPPPPPPPPGQNTTDANLIAAALIANMNDMPRPPPSPLPNGGEKAVEEARLAAEAEETAREAAEAEAYAARLAAKATKLQSRIRGNKGRKEAKEAKIAAEVAREAAEAAREAAKATKLQSRIRGNKGRKEAKDIAKAKAARLAAEEAARLAAEEVAEAKAAAARLAAEKTAREAAEKADAKAKADAEKAARLAAEKEATAARLAREEAEREAEKAAKAKADAELAEELKKKEEIKALKIRLKDLKPQITNSIPKHHASPKESDVTNSLQKLLHEFSYEQTPKFSNYKAAVTEISNLDPNKLRNILKEFNSKIDPKKDNKDTLSTSKKELKENLKKLLKKKFKKPVIFYILNKAIEILNTLINEATNTKKILNTRINEATNPNIIFDVSDNTLHSIAEAFASSYYIETSSEETEDEKNEEIKDEKKAIENLFIELITDENTLKTATIGKKIDEIIDNKLETEGEIIDNNQKIENEFRSLVPNSPILNKTNNNNTKKKAK